MPYATYTHSLPWAGSRLAIASSLAAKVARLMDDVTFVAMRRELGIDRAGRALMAPSPRACDEISMRSAQLIIYAVDTARSIL